MKFGNSPIRGGLGTILWAVALLVQANADPIVYTFSGAGSGNVNGSPFVDAPFTIQAFADISDVAPYIIPDNPQMVVFQVGISISTINISGIGSGSFTTPKVVFVNQTVVTSGFSDAGTPFPDLYDLQNSALASYDLKSTIGPIFDANAYIIASQFRGIGSTMGDISFTSSASPGGGTFTAQLVPEPCVSALLGVGVLALLVWRAKVRKGADGTKEPASIR